MLPNKADAKVKPIQKKTQNDIGKKFFKGSRLPVKPIQTSNNNVSREKKLIKNRGLISTSEDFWIENFSITVFRVTKTIITKVKVTTAPPPIINKSVGNNITNPRCPA